MDKPYGLLFAAFDYSNVAEDEFNAWYDTEHIPERMRIQGFLNAQRWIGVDNPKIAVATYDVESVAVLQQPAYTSKKGAGQSPWTVRIETKAKLFCRIVAEQLLPGRAAGPDEARGLLVVAFDVKPEAVADFTACRTRNICRRSRKFRAFCARGASERSKERRSTLRFIT